MFLSQLIALRAEPAAGLSLGITRRCPLSCAHCSTGSTMRSEELPEAVLRRFVGTFTRQDHPRILSMSGGEAMLRPRLVEDLASLTRRVGGKATALTGLFFATSRRIPRDIHRAIGMLDHLSVSIDSFHEREVPRDRVMAVLEQLLGEGVDLSIHTIAAGAADCYVDGLVADLTRRFDRRIPVLVNRLGYFGRARGWLDRPVDAAVAPDIDPCAMAGWPVMGFDGTIVACGNDDALDVLPAHLRLGHAAEDDWPTIRRRTLESALLRAIRAIGPLGVAEAAGRTGCSGYCGTCLALSSDPRARHFAEAEIERPAMAVLEYQVEQWHRANGAAGFARRHGVPHYASLVEQGAAVEPAPRAERVVAA